jgi:gluconate 2-dehydrogenase gamma chain
MTAHDEGRRSFLITSVIGVGAVAGSALPRTAEAQQLAETSPATKPPPSPPATRRSELGGPEWRTFFTEDESFAVKAIAERIMPGAPGIPGATDANVINYIDLALSGAYSDQQEFYRRGLASLDNHCRAAFKDAFMNLQPAQQDEALAAMESGKATGFTWPAPQAFFTALRTHTMEGMFSDPVYGGNRDFVGWELVGFPGAQRIFTTAELKSDGAFRGPIVGLNATHDASRGGK